MTDTGKHGCPNCGDWKINYPAPMVRVTKDGEQYRNRRCTVCGYEDQQVNDHGWRTDVVFNEGVGVE